MFEIKIEKGDNQKTRKIKRQFMKLQKQSQQMDKEIEEAQRVEVEVMQSIVY